MVLLHGTTRQRAEGILKNGPDPRFREPGGTAMEDGFSLYLESGPFHFGRPEDYALGKADEFPDEGGPVILELDVPEEIVANAADGFFPLGQGLVQFEHGFGLEELTSSWPMIAATARIRSIP